MWTAGAGQGGERAACYMDSTYNTGRGSHDLFQRRVIFNNNNVIMS